MNSNSNRTGNNIELIIMFIKLMHSNPKIEINQKLYNTIRSRIQGLVNDIQKDNDFMNEIQNSANYKIEETNDWINQYNAG